MKNIIYLVGAISLIACDLRYEKETIKINNPSYVERDNLVMDETEFDLNGTWGLTNYFDTIIENKEIAKYRIQTPTWFAFLLVIENDSLKSFGSIGKDEYFIEKNSDTLTTITSDVAGDNWYLIIDKPKLKLVQYLEEERGDSTVYTFRKRDDLNYFTHNNIGFSTISKNVTEYFHEHLFKGKYRSTDSQKEVVFDENGRLTGIDGFNSYEVKNYFGTSHRHKNLDVITFKNSENNEYKEYNWVFSYNELVLTEFVNEKRSHKGENYYSDHLILGKKRIKLKKH